LQLYHASYFSFPLYETPQKYFPSKDAS